MKKILVFLLIFGSLTAFAEKTVYRDRACTITYDQSAELTKYKILVNGNWEGRKPHHGSNISLDQAKYYLEKYFVDEGKCNYSPTYDEIVYGVRTCTITYHHSAELTKYRILVNGNWEGRKPHHWSSISLDQAKYYLEKYFVDEGKCDD